MPLQHQKTCILQCRKDSFLARREYPVSPSGRLVQCCTAVPPWNSKSRHLLNRQLERSMLNFLAYGWRSGNLNLPIRIQQAGINLVFWRLVNKSGKASKSGNFLTGNCIKYSRNGIYNFETIPVGKKWKIWTSMCFYVLAPKMGRRGSAWQIARSSPGIAR